MSTLEKLLNLQENDNRILQLERELKDIPERKKIEEARLESHRQSVSDSEEQLKSLQAKINELEVEGDSSKEKIAKLRQQQMELKTNKEFKAVESEIATLEKGIRALEDRELEFMSEADEIRSDLDGSKEELAREESSLKQDLAAWDERATSLEGELTQAQSDRDAAAGVVDDEELLENYQRVHGRRENAIVQLVDGVCGGCNMKLPPSVSHIAKRNDGAATCDYCGRLLYNG